MPQGRSPARRRAPRGTDWRGDRHEGGAVSSDLPQGPLRLGPLLRYVDTTSATVWVETAAAAHVVVAAGPVRAETRTFAAHGHHYALVEVDGLPPGTPTPYQVLVDDEQVWPPGDPEFA